MANVTATKFEQLVQADRSRKKNEALAAKIFGKERRQSAPLRGSNGNANSNVTGAGSLASRAGIKKRVASTSNLRSAAAASTAPTKPGNINVEWTHDLHGTHAASTTSSKKRGTGSGSGSGVGSLASRVSRPGDPPKRQQRRAAQVANALIRAEQQQERQKQNQRQNQRQQSHQNQNQNQRQQNQQNQIPTQPRNGPGISIRGLAAAAAEPLVVMAQNFAPGTTAADIESAVTPVGGLVSSCRIVKTSPLVIAELVFESREGAEQVIQTFHNQTADGRVLQVYAKTVGTMAAVAATTTTTTINNNQGLIVDGSMGFDDPMDTDGLRTNQVGNNTSYHNNNNNNSRNNGGKLYSDDLVGSRGNNGRRGRGRGGRR